MKKSWFFLAAAALVVGCTEDNVRNEVDTEEFAIGFIPSFMEKTTRANAGEMIIQSDPAINTMEVNGNTFEVWGWVTRTAGTTKLFDNQTVTYNSSNLTTTSSTGWAYDPIKYWDRTASYKFYATAPAGAFTLNESDDTESDRKFSATIPSDKLVQILHDENGTSKIKLATAATGDAGTASQATDYLVAAVVSCAAGIDNQGNASDKDVAFTFSHILSKLTVKVKTTTDFNHTGDAKPQIKLTNLKIKLTGMAQNYAQKTAGAINAGSTDKDAWTNATNTPVEKVCFNADGTTVQALLLSTTAEEVAGYFVAPTTTGTTGTDAVEAGSATVKVTAKYDLYYSDGVVDHCETEETTVTNLTSFVQNTHNILTVTVAPQAILFDVQTVAGFSPVTEVEQEVN